MTTPPRPKNVPETARYEAESDPDWRWVVGEVDADGEAHGPTKTYADAGYLHAEATYVHGKPEGENVVYHPDGTVASIGYWRDKKCFDALYKRPIAPSPEAFPGDVDARVMSVRYVANEDATANEQILYFDAAGNEVTTAGEPMPPHPAGVDPKARFFPTQGKWMMGGVMRGATPKSVGTVKSWTHEGRLLSHAEHAPDGELRERRTYHDNGKLYIHERHESGKKIFAERYREDGSLRSKELSDTRGRKTYAGSFAPDGATLEESEWKYEGDTLVHHVVREKGAPRMEVTQDGAGHRCRLFESGVLLAEGRVENQRLAGEWIVYAAGGKQRAAVDAARYEVTAKRLEPGAIESALATALYRDVEPKLGEIAVLEDIGKVPWSDLEGAYGNGEGFDGYLRALTASEPLVRDFAMGNIYSEALHQGSVYPVTGAVMPYLIRLLDVASVDRAAVLKMIFEFASAAGGYTNSAEQIVAQEDADEEELTWAKACLAIVDAVGAGWPTLAKLLERGTLAEQAQVIALAGAARGDADIAAEVKRIAREAPTPEARAIAVDALASRKGTDPADIAACYEDKDALVRLSAAIAAGLRLARNAPAGTDAQLAWALDTFIAERESGDTLSQRYYALPFVRMHPFAYLACAMGNVRNERTFALARSLGSLIDACDGSSAAEFAVGLLALAFGKCEKPFMPGFVDVLDMLANSKKLFVFNVNGAESCRRFGLPVSAAEGSEALVELVRKLRASDDPEQTLCATMHGE